MKFVSKSYDKILVVEFSDTVDIEDIKTLDVDIPVLAQKYPFIIFSFEKAAIDNQLVVVLGKIREKHKLKKSRLSFVSARCLGADFKALDLALDGLKTSDGMRAAEVLLLTAKVEKSELQVSQSFLEASNLLRKGVGQEPSSEPFNDQDFELNRNQLLDRTNRLRYLYKVLGGEIEKLQKGATKASSVDAQKLEDLKKLKKKAVAVLKAGELL